MRWDFALKICHAQTVLAVLFWICHKAKSILAILPINSSSQRYPLLLTPGQINAFLPDLGLVSGRKHVEVWQ